MVTRFNINNLNVWKEIKTSRHIIMRSLDRDYSHDHSHLFVITFVFFMLTAIMWYLETTKHTLRKVIKNIYLIVN